MTYTLHAYFLPEHREQPAVARTAEEVNAIIDELLAQDYDSSMATMVIAEQRDADEYIAELSIGVDPDRGVGSAQYATPDGAWFTKGQPSTHPEVLYCYFGNEREFPHDSEIPLSELRTVVATFLATGGRRTGSVSWQDAMPVAGPSSGQ